MKSNLFVFDTNTLISAALSPSSTNAEAMKKAESLGNIIYSDATWTEFLEVLFRKKFDKYFSIENRYEIVDRLITRFEKRSIDVVITECRDAKDNMFLELAVSAKATCIISGDADLLILNTFRNIPIIDPKDFIDHY
jgi:uncharacterized protein